MKHRARSPRRRHSGFALIITIVLVAFLVLLLVGLATFTRVETQVADNSQTQARARQNALLALNVAIGRLQAAAGPDTRVTATADIVTGRHIDKKNWTGVWNASASGADKNIAWLVSGTAPAGAAGASGALAAASGNSLVELVGAGSTDISDPTTGNRVQVETQPITSDTVPGMTGAQTIGNIAYWVGDEGVKAKVNLTDPWESPASATLAASEPDTTATQAALYRFVHAQRTGTEALGYDAGDTRLAAAANPIATAAFKTALPKVLSMPQLTMAGASAAAQTALASAAKHRFHDITTDSTTVLANVAQGGLKKDLTAWLADTSGSATPDDDAFITPPASDDAAGYGLPKWGLIRSYGNTRDTGAALAPRRQTPTQQGVYPVITYARMAYNVTCPGGALGGIYKINVMPAVALWNPYNVPIAASPGGGASFEFCVRYEPASTAGNRLQLITYAGTNNGARDYFNINNISISETAPGTSANTTYYGTGPDTQFWRFKVKLTQDLAPGESRLFTIDDSDDDTVFEIGESTLSDAAVDSANAVHLLSRRALSANQMAAPKNWNTEPSNSNLTKMEILLAPPVPSGVSSATDIETYLRANACQTIAGFAVSWSAESNDITIPATNTGSPFVYQRFELNMSALPTNTDASSGSGNAGTPRWLANLNPQATASLRKPASSNRIPAYTRHAAIIGESTFSAGFPNTDGGSVSAGTRVSTTGAAQNLVLREFQPAGIPLFSLAQLQHANVSSINLNPTYAIGNSLANLYVARNAADARSPTLGADSHASVPAAFKHIYDLSYLLNKALWDGYYFSTVPASLTPAEVLDANYRLPNARHHFHWSDGGPTAAKLAELKATPTASKHLLLDGGFNINSTSVQAWRALLHAHNGLATDPADSDNKHPFSRFTAPVAGSQPNATWLGYRILSDDQIDALAVAIVARIRTRGRPFLSLADFVNRDLAADDTGLKGLLQTAIDANTSGSAAINADSSMPVTAYYAGDITATEDQIIYKGDTATALPSSSPSTSRAAFAPGFLTQADLLTAIGANLTARSDTFRIRAYGDVVNPATGAATPDARAWCEAIVQRFPDYVDPSLDAAALPAAGSTNETFGRRFKIVSFRWLSPDDL